MSSIVVVSRTLADESLEKHNLVGNFDVNEIDGNHPFDAPFFDKQ